MLVLVVIVISAKFFSELVTYLVFIDASNLSRKLITLPLLAVKQLKVSDVRQDFKCVSGQTNGDG